MQNYRLSNPSMTKKLISKYKLSLAQNLIFDSNKLKKISLVCDVSYWSSKPKS